MDKQEQGEKNEAPADETSNIGFPVESFPCLPLVLFHRGRRKGLDIESPQGLSQLSDMPRGVEDIPEEVIPCFLAILCELEPNLLHFIGSSRRLGRLRDSLPFENT